MDENAKPRWRFSLSAALAVMLAIGVVLGIMRLSIPVAMIVAMVLVVCSGCAVIARSVGREAIEDVLWGVVISSVLFAAWLFLFTGWG